VLESAYRALVQDVRRLVLWVPAISQESFELAYREIGVRLRIPGISDDNADIKKLVKAALSGSTHDWLMIVDNADDPDVLISRVGEGALGVARLFEYLPEGHRGKIVFTTRSRKAARDLTQSSVLELHDMGRAEAKRMLERRISRQGVLGDTKAVDELLELLAYLPLAIVQAAAFIDNNDMTVRGYVSLLQNTSSKDELFGEHFEDPSRYQEMDSTIIKTWHISFNQMRKQDALAAEYLSFMACVDRINIPQSLLLPGGSKVQQAKAIGTLKGYAFITEQQATTGLANEKFFDVHRLVHMASGWWLDSQDERKGWVAKAAGRLEELVPYGGHEDKDIWTKYLPHAIHVGGLDGILEEEIRTSLLDRVGRCLASLGQYSAAETTHQQVLLLREKRLGKEDELVLASLNEIGVALERQGKYSEAETMLWQTMATREKVLGLDHPDTLTNMNNLAKVLNSQGKYAEAESMLRQTMATSERVLGLDHSDTLTTMNNLAEVLNSQGKYSEAESMLRQTRATSERVLGLDYPSTLTSMANPRVDIQESRPVVGGRRAVCAGDRDEQEETRG
jgi:tetratricopeptide (TPR) repeat protein